MRKWYLIGIAFLCIFILLFYWRVILRLFYPIHYAAEISVHTQTLDLDPYLIAAIIRVESNFQPEVRSAKGAIGLMQLMPETARWVANRLGYDFITLRLTDPNTNIQLGTWYLAFLKREFDDNLIAALAAYNGGRGNVERWLAESRWNGSRERLRDIPFLETRLYVQKVLAVYGWYRKLYGKRWPPTPIYLPLLPGIGRQIEIWWQQGWQLWDYYRRRLQPSQ